MTGAGELLGMLGGLGRLAGRGPTGAGPEGVRSGGASFEDLLARAHAGEARSDLPVTISPRAGVDLSEDQLSRLAVVADRAHAAGVSVAAVEIDGMTLTLDVLQRQVTGVMREGDVLTGIDALVRAPADDEGKGVSIGVPDATATNASLVDALARRGDSDGRAA